MEEKLVPLRIGHGEEFPFPNMSEIDIEFAKNNLTVGILKRLVHSNLIKINVDAERKKITAELILFVPENIYESLINKPEETAFDQKEASKAWDMLFMDKNKLNAKLPEKD